MAQITLDQIYVPLKLDPNDPLRLILSGSLYVSGSQDIVDSPNIATSSLFVSGGLDGGTF